MLFMQAAVQVSLDLDLAHCTYAFARQRTVPFEVEAPVFNDLSLAPEMCKELFKRLRSQLETAILLMQGKGRCLFVMELSDVQ